MINALVEILLVLMNSTIPGDQPPGWFMPFTNSNFTAGLYSIDRQALRCRRKCTGAFIYAVRQEGKTVYLGTVQSPKGAKGHCAFVGYDDGDCIDFRSCNNPGFLYCREKEEKRIE